MPEHFVEADVQILVEFSTPEQPAGPVARSTQGKRIKFGPEVAQGGNPR
jgi:hypothetical protein